MLRFIAKCQIYNILFLPVLLGVSLCSNCNLMADTLSPLRLLISHWEIKSQKLHATLLSKISSRLVMKEELRKKLGWSLNSEGERQKSIVVGAVQLCSRRCKTFRLK